MRPLVRSSALIGTYFDTLPPPLAPLARSLQKVVLAAAPGLEQAVKWGNLVFLHEGRNLLAIAAHKAHLSLQFFHGAELAARFPVLDGSGKGLRQLKLKPGQGLDEALIAELVRASLQLAAQARGDRHADRPERSSEDEGA